MARSYKFVGRRMGEVLRVVMAMTDHIRSMSTMFNDFANLGNPAML